MVGVEAEPPAERDGIDAVVLVVVEIFMVEVAGDGQVVGEQVAGQATLGTTHEILGGIAAVVEAEIAQQRIFFFIQHGGGIGDLHRIDQAGPVVGDFRGCPRHAPDPDFIEPQPTRETVRTAGGRLTKDQRSVVGVRGRHGARRLFHDLGGLFGQAVHVERQRVLVAPEFAREVNPLPQRQGPRRGSPVGLAAQRVDFDVGHRVESVDGLHAEIERACFVAPVRHFDVALDEGALKRVGAGFGFEVYPRFDREVRREILPAGTARNRHALIVDHPGRARHQRIVRLHRTRGLALFIGVHLDFQRVRQPVVVRVRTGHRILEGQVVGHGPTTDKRPAGIRQNENVVHDRVRHGEIAVGIDVVPDRIDQRRECGIPVGVVVLGIGKRHAGQRCRSHYRSQRATVEQDGVAHGVNAGRGHRLPDRIHARSEHRVRVLVIPEDVRQRARSGQHSAGGHATQKGMIAHDQIAWRVDARHGHGLPERIDSGRVPAIFQPGRLEVVESAHRGGERLEGAGTVGRQSRIHRHVESVQALAILHVQFHHVVQFRERRHADDRSPVRYRHGNVRRRDGVVDHQGHRRPRGEEAREKRRRIVHGKRSGIHARGLLAAGAVPDLPGPGGKSAERAVIDGPPNPRDRLVAGAGHEVDAIAVLAEIFLVVHQRVGIGIAQHARNIVVRPRVQSVFGFPPVRNAVAVAIGVVRLGPALRRRHCRPLHRAIRQHAHEMLLGAGARIRPHRAAPQHAGRRRTWVA